MKEKVMNLTISLSADYINDLLSLADAMKIRGRRSTLRYASGDNEEYVRAFLNSVDRDAWVDAGVGRRRKPSNQISPQVREMAREVFEEMSAEFMNYLKMKHEETASLGIFVQEYRTFERAYNFGKAYTRLALVYKLMGGSIDRQKAEEIVEALNK
jgi:hypothetical protein